MPGTLVLRFGEDAIDARIFRVKLSRTSTCEGNETIHLELSDQYLVLKAQVLKEMQKGHSTYSIIESNGIAFDHAKIIILALERSGLVT